MVYTPLKSYPNFGTSRATPPIAFPATVMTGTTWSSDLMLGGFGNVLFAATSDQIVTLQIQRFADLAGLIPVGALLTQALAANTPNSIASADNIPFLTWAAAIVNASGSLATISNPALLTGAQR